MQTNELILFLVLLSFFLYWLNSIRAKEIATRYASDRCTNLGVNFLDETVVSDKLRLKRNRTGSLSFYREYGFEFSTTGERRYKGRICLLGKELQDLYMDPYIANEDPDRLSHF